MKIRKHLSSFENSSCLVKNKVSLVLFTVMYKKNSMEKLCLLHWAKDVSCYLLKMIHKWSDHRNFTRINYWSWGSRYPSLTSCKACINCFFLHYHRDSSYRCFSFLSQLSAELHVATSTRRSSCLISVRSFAENRKPVVSSAMLSLDAFTGCDSISCFKRKGKIKPFDLMKETEEFVDTFRLKSCNRNLTEDLFQRLEKFVCRIFGLRNVSFINDARFNIF